MAFHGNFIYTYVHRRIDIDEEKSRAFKKKA